MKTIGDRLEAFTVTGVKPGFDKLTQQFAERDAVLMGGATDSEFAKLGWRREHKDLSRLKHCSFADVAGSLVIGAPRTWAQVSISENAVLFTTSQLHASQPTPKKRLSPCS